MTIDKQHKEKNIQWNSVKHIKQKTYNLDISKCNDEHKISNI